MSVGAGSIKRAARTAKAENKTAVITGAEAEVTEAVTGAELMEQTEENAAGRKDTAMGASEKKEKKPGGKKEKAVDKSSGKRVQQKKAEGTKKQRTVAAETAVPEADVLKNTGAVEIYGIGQQLPTYLL